MRVYRVSNTITDTSISMMLCNLSKVAERRKIDLFQTPNYDKWLYWKAQLVYFQKLSYPHLLSKSEAIWSGQFISGQLIKQYFMWKTLLLLNVNCQIGIKIESIPIPWEFFNRWHCFANTEPLHGK